MENLSLFDLHCDTAGEMLATGQPLGENSLAVSLSKATAFCQYVQVMALWANDRLSDAEGWRQVRRMVQNLKKDPAVANGDVGLGTVCPERADGVSLLLGLEDARVLELHPERVDELFEMGVRIFTPLWRGVTCIGGAHDTNEGLTDFGELAVRRALERGMVPDISHASVASADEMFDLAAEYSRPVVASHSNAYAVTPVSRNLRDEQIRAVVNSRGLIGLNLYTAFLASDHPATVTDVLRHAEYFLSHGAEHALALGCDMDGADLPQDLHDLAALPALAECFLRHNYSESLVRNIFFENAYRVLRAALNPS